MSILKEIILFNCQTTITSFRFSFVSARFIVLIIRHTKHDKQGFFLEVQINYLRVRRAWLQAFYTVRPFCPPGRQNSPSTKFYRITAQFSYSNSFYQNQNPKKIFFFIL